MAPTLCQTWVYAVRHFQLAVHRTDRIILNVLIRMPAVIMAFLLCLKI